MRNGFFGIGACIAISAGVILAFNLLGGVLIVVFFGSNIKNIDPQALLIVNATSQVIIMIGLSFLLLKGLNTNPRKILRLSSNITETPQSAFLFCIPLVIVAQIFGTALSSLWNHFLSLSSSLHTTLSKIQKVLDEMMKDVTNVDTPEKMLLALFTIALIPAISEEIFFRGFIQTNIEQSATPHRPITAIVITSLLFGTMHMSPFNIPGLAVVGALLGWLVWRTNDLRIGMFAHLFNNGIIVVLLYSLRDIQNLEDSLSGSEALPLDLAFISLSISGVVLGGLLAAFNSIIPQQNTTISSE